MFSYSLQRVLWHSNDLHGEPLFERDMTAAERDTDTSMVEADVDYAGEEEDTCVSYEEEDTCVS